MIRRRGPLVTGSLQTGRGADLGLCLVFCSALLALPTVLSMHGGRGGAGAVLLAAVAVSVGVRLLPWDGWGVRWLLVWPMVVLGVVFALAVVGQSSASTVSGLPVLAFFYVGLTQPRWSGIALLPLALLAWVAASGGLSDLHVILLRLPITVGVWVIVSETLSALRARLQQLTAELRGQALEDSLTGLASRRVFDSQIVGLGPGDAVVFIDLDNFKQVNDQEGHMAGDALLAEFGAALREAVRSGDLAARFGGEEFVLVLVGSGMDGAVAMIDRLRDEWKAKRPTVTFSAGVSLVRDGQEQTSAVARADRALYDAKAAGRDITVMASGISLDLPTEL